MALPDAERDTITTRLQTGLSDVDDYAASLTYNWENATHGRSFKLYRSRFGKFAREAMQPFATGGLAWVSDLTKGDAFTGSSSTPAAVAGYPSITVPAGFIGGLPVGVSFFGAAWSEPVLVAIALAFEQHTRARRPPAYAPTLAGP
jgi:hypothetical protein